MAQLERPQRQVDASSKTPTINSMEQLLRAGEGSHSAPNSKSKLSPTCSPSSSATSSSPSSPFFSRLRHRDTEEDNSQNQKKSVLTKVKEKAKKLRHSLSKKKQEDGNANSPTSGAILEGDGAEEDAEYRGAPVYESEKAPAGYKENGTLHSRATSAVPEKHVMSNYDKQNREKSLGHSQSMRTTQPKTTTSKAAAATTTLPDRNKTMAKSVAEKLKPAHFEVSDAAKDLTSKLQDLTVSKSAEHHTSSSLTAAPLITHHFSSSIGTAAPRTPPAKLPSQTSSISPRTSSPSAAAAAPPPSPSSAPPIGKSTSPTSSQLWDKGVSMKEYFLNKFEPGEDDKALSKVISEAMSPKRTPGDAGVMEKVREAVTSLLRNEQPNKYADANTTITSSSQTPASSTATRASSQLPVSSNAQEVAQEENHGRILQAN